MTLSRGCFFCFSLYFVRYFTGLNFKKQRTLITVGRGHLVSWGACRQPRLPLEECLWPRPILRRYKRAAGPNWLWWQGRYTWKSPPRHPNVPGVFGPGSRDSSAFTLFTRFWASSGYVSLSVRNLNWDACAANSCPERLTTIMLLRDPENLRRVGIPNSGFSFPRLLPAMG